MDDQRPYQTGDTEVQQTGAGSPPVKQPSVVEQSAFVNHWQTDKDPGNSPQTAKPAKRLHIPILIVAVVAVVVGAAVVIHVITAARRFPLKIDNSADIVKPPAKPASGDTPLGHTAYGSSDTADLSMKVVRVMDDPPVAGDAPDAGKKYVEIDLSVTNHGKASAIIPGTFVYQSTGGNLINTADTTSAGSNHPEKNISLAGKESLNDLSLGGGQTANPVYIIYQVPATDKGGKLIWYDGYYDTSSTKLAIFDLN